MAYAVGAPGVMSVLQSCTNKVSVWTPVFFSEDEKLMVENLVDIILPVSELPGGSDVNLAQFIDVMVKDTFDDEKQDVFQRGYKVFSSKFKEKFGNLTSFTEGDKMKELFSDCFDVSDDESSNILRNQAKSENDIEPSERDHYAMYKFLFTVRNLSLLGYYTSEKISKDVLNFDPIPGVWQPCVPLEEIGNSWAI